ncbi:unnamed protein product [Arabis nemorensis]|uniref:Uncharacterized protein n=1 Tax=Arabis nemorensis TaxID=586526 RepID=A0A565CKJ4_9BRAS|nr:unnamed protein product [Arabis nemorensis]
MSVFDTVLFLFYADNSSHLLQQLQKLDWGKMQLLMQKLILITSLSRRINASDFTELGKNAALDISKVIDMLIEEFAKSPQANHQKISKIIDMLIEEFAKSPQANHRKGGLIGLAAVTIGLSSEAAQRYLEEKTACQSVGYLRSYGRFILGGFCSFDLRSVQFEGGFPSKRWESENDL